MRLSLWIGTLFAAALIVGCGGGDGDGGGDDSGGSAPSDATTASDASGGGGGTIELEPFSIPLPSGAVAETFRNDRGVSVYYPVDDYDAIVAFFDGWTDAESDVYVRTETTDPNVTTSWAWLGDAAGEIRTISVAQDFDGGNNFGTVTFIQVADEKTP